MEAGGVRHEVRARIDPAGELRIVHREDEVPTAAGTRVTVAIPSEGQSFDPGFWVRSFALYNPYATITYSYRANGHDPQIRETYKSTEPRTFKKYRPADPTSAFWYDEPAMKRLVFSHISHARNGGRDLPLGEFVRQFRGLSGTKKAKAVAAILDDVSRLSDFEERPERVGGLLAAMREHSRAPSHDFPRFGRCGAPPHPVRSCLRRLGVRLQEGGGPFR